MKEDFRRYVLEQFGMEISFRKSDKVDTFESLFGASFISKDELRIGVSVNVYNDSSSNISIDMEYDPIKEYDLQQDLALAA